MTNQIELFLFRTEKDNVYISENRQRWWLFIKFLVLIR